MAMEVTLHPTDLVEVSFKGLTVRTHQDGSDPSPFDLFLAADRRRPLLLEQERLTVPGTRFTYAVGRLTLWSRDADRITGDGPDVLRRGQFNYLAIANPKTAPYGAAAMATLTKLGLADSVRGKLVQGENIAQTHQFVASGNAELGFVAQIGRAHV